MTDHIYQKIRQSAERVLEIELNAVKLLKDIDFEAFSQLCNALFEAKGKIIVTGIGKSAIIAQKFVSTLNSTGSRAQFIHAADALHGDLGMIQKEDAVIMLSNSGSTPELKVLLSVLKQNNYQIAAITSKANSTLAKQANYTLLLPESREACPNNLAPTASTTMQLVICDAIAVALLELRGFTQEDFAQTHPAGALGKKVYLRVEDLMSDSSIPSIAPESSVEQVIISISGGRMGATAVCNANNEVLGIITDGDLRRMMEKTKDYSNLKAGEIMSENPVHIEPEELVVDAFALMKERKISQLIVAKNGQLKGFLHLQDIIREGII